MFMEVFLLFVLFAFSNWNVVINSAFLVLFFLKTCMYYCNLSFFQFKLDSSFVVFDKLGTLLILLTTISVLMIFLSNWDLSSFFYFLNKILFISLILVSVASNLLLFYFLFEITIIPTIMLILIWGYQPERLQAAFYFFFYTIIASLPLLVFILFAFSKNKSNLMMNFYSPSFSSIWWIVSILAFLIKFPMFFFHLWLPKAHVEAPLGGSMILAAVLLKLGGIGIYRMMMMYKSFICSSFISSLSIWGSILTVLICLQQSDLKAMIAYSSVAHMSFLIASMLLGTETGMNGAMLMMFFHGLSSAGLFMLAKMTYDLTKSRSLVLSKGKMNLIPIFTLFWAIMITMNMGVPPAGSFWSEIFLMFGFLFKSPVFFLLFFVLAFFSTTYSIFMMINVHHGKPISKMNPQQSFNKANFCPMFIFAFMSFALFIFPSAFFLF